jgi:hypothetical protein
MTLRLLADIEDRQVNVFKNTQVRPHMVHPRVCGENYLGRKQMELTNGSPPRVRGKPSFFDNIWFMVPVHPRVCGENTILTQWIIVMCGSAPRVRGKLVNTLQCGQYFSVHPRVCGVNTIEGPCFGNSAIASPSREI